MKRPETQALYGYWLQQCRGRSTPDRHDLDPAEMRGVLPYTFMLDVGLRSPTNVYRIRLSGTRLDALFDTSVKGRDFLELLAEEDRRSMALLLADMLDESRAAVVGLKGAPSGYDAVNFELLLLPLRHHGRTHERVLCSLVPSSVPSWMGLQTVGSIALASWRFVERTMGLQAGADRGAIRHRHLTVIEGGRAAA